MSGCYLEPCTYSSCVYILVKLQCVLEWPTTVTMTPFSVFQRIQSGFTCDGLWRQTCSDFWRWCTSWTDTLYATWRECKPKPSAGQLTYLTSRSEHMNRVAQHFPIQAAIYLVDWRHWIPYTQLHFHSTSGGQCILLWLQNCKQLYRRIGYDACMLNFAVSR